MMKTRLLYLIIPILFLGSSVLAQSLTGVVKDSLGAPIEYAAVGIKGSNVHSSTDHEGKFNIDAGTQFPVTLIISSFGYKPFEVQVTDPSAPLNISLTHDYVQLNEVTVTSRRRKEVVQDIPIPISVISGQTAEDAGAFNVNRLKELVPTVQLYASNGRNTTLNIRGLGSTFGLTNDGIDPGVGFYVDGVYYARPAATSLDFIDVDQIEVLRGPQGTLFGKNTTAGAFNITTKKPSQKPSAKVELSYGNYNFIQAKTSVTGGLTKNLSARASFSGTQRQGTIYNPNDQRRYNGQNNLGAKGQLYYTPSKRLEILFSGDVTVQRPDGYSLVTAGVTTTERSAYRQYAKIISDLGYNQPKIDPFAREIYTNSPWRHDQSMGGLSLNVDYKIGKGTLTSTTAWRYWNWDPSNDRDFSEVSALTKSQGTSRHDQYSQEIRYAGEITKKLSGVVGVYALAQELKGLDQKEEVGKDQWRFLSTKASEDAAYKAAIGNGMGINTNSYIHSLSAAVFAQADWEFLKGVHILPGLRYTYDKKDVIYNRTTYGGSADPALQSTKDKVYTNQKFATNVDNENLSGNLTLAYKPTDKINVFGTFSTGYKPVGVNVGGLPSISATNPNPDLSVAVVKPEYTQHYEVGIKTKPVAGAILNVIAFNTDITDYQTNVQSPQLGVNRGYLANAEKVNVKGLEVDGSYQLQKFLTFNAALAYTDGRYVSFKNAPLPLEETGHTEIIEGVATQVAYKDASGGVLPGISNWNGSAGIELSTKGTLISKTGRYFIASDFSYRSEYSSNATPSKVLKISDYGLINARLGFRADNFTVFIWGRNLANTNYYEQLQAAAGNSGLYAGVLGDPRTYGVTFRYGF